MKSLHTGVQLGWALWLLLAGRALAAPSSPADNDDNPQHKDHRRDSGTVPVTIVLLISSALSAIGAGLVVWSFLSYKRLRRHPSQIIVSRSIADLMFCILICVGHMLPVQTSSPESDPRCEVISLLSQYTGLAAELYIGALAADMVTSLTNPFTNSRFNLRLYHAVVLVLAAASTAFLATVKDNGFPIYGRDDDLGICWVRHWTDTDGSHPNVWFWLVFNVPVAVIYLFGVYTVIFVRNRLDRGLRATFHERSEAFSHSFVFVVTYLGYWGTIASLYTVLRVGGDSTQWLSLVLAAVMGLRGVVTAAVWVCTHDFRKARFLRMRALALRRPEVTDLRPQITVALRREVLYYTTLGIRKAVLFYQRAYRRHKTGTLLPFQPLEVIPASPSSTVDSRGFTPRPSSRMTLDTCPVVRLTLDRGHEEGLKAAQRQLDRRRKFKATKRSVDQWRAATARTMSNSSLGATGRGLDSQRPSLRLNEPLLPKPHKHVLPPKRSPPLEAKPLTDESEPHDRRLSLNNDPSESKAGDRFDEPRSPRAEGWSEKGDAESSLSIGRKDKRPSMEPSECSDTPGGGKTNLDGDKDRMGESVLDSAASQPGTVVFGGMPFDRKDMQADLEAIQNEDGEPEDVDGEALLSQLQSGQLDFEQEALGEPPSAPVPITRTRPPLVPMPASGQGSFGSSQRPDGSWQPSSMHLPSTMAARPMGLADRLRADQRGMHPSVSSVELSRAGRDTPGLSEITADSPQALLGAWGQGDAFDQEAREEALMTSHTDNHTWSHSSSDEETGRFAGKKALRAPLHIGVPREDSVCTGSAALPSVRSRVAHTDDDELFHGEIASGAETQCERLLHGCCLAYCTFGHNCGVTSHDDFVFFDFVPGMFARVRMLSGITNYEYVRALQITKREKFSEGSSGAFLYFSDDERFIVKTMEREELAVLIEMLDEYVSHLERNPNSLVTRFLGCHAIRMYGRMMYFAVLNNVLTGQGHAIHERYDLKGSWVNRHHKPIERGKFTDCRYCGEKFRVGDSARRNPCPARPNRGHAPHTVMKDNDLTTRLKLNPEISAAIAEQIGRDCRFLERQGIMDYSLLLGLHRSRYAVLSDYRATSARLSVPLSPRLGPDAPIVRREILARQVSGNSSAYGMPRASSGRPTHPLVSVPSEGFLETDDGSNRVSLGKAPERKPRTRLSEEVRESGGSGSGPGEDSSDVRLALAIWSDEKGAPAPVPFDSRPPIVGDMIDDDFPISAAAAAATTAPPPVRELRKSKRQHQQELARRLQREAVQLLRVPGLLTAHKGGLMASVVEGPSVYYMGLIDVLQRYSWRKRMERFVKTRLLCRSAEGISAVPPRAYARRFERRVVDQLFDKYHGEFHYLGIPELEELDGPTWAPSGGCLSWICLRLCCFGDDE
jgi:hypothetical protein